MILVYLTANKTKAATTQVKTNSLNLSWVDA